MITSEYLRLLQRLSLYPRRNGSGKLVPKLTEKAKSIYLEKPDPAAQNFENSKSIFIKGYQLTSDHYRYMVTSEKKLAGQFQSCYGKISEPH